eukprot:TRINITY_DN4343_c0_g1_i1.p1 TRINITY_DN4343_c0_g1~~TRINITY_DN4343_c0_g1_i1.p1  ORF type:complete len:152 (+),score=53.38 TRINITY_DN4343_c0_g1_i1:152-607(+)
METGAVVLRSAEPGEAVRLGRPLTAEEEASLRRMFDKLDRNGNGVVSRGEVIRALREDEEVRTFLHLPAQIRQESAEHTEFERTFQRMDADNDRDITWEEFRSAFTQRRCSTAGNGEVYVPQENGVALVYAANDGPGAALLRAAADPSTAA